MSYDARQEFIKQASERSEPPVTTKLIPPKKPRIDPDVIAQEIALMSSKNFIVDEEV